MKKNQIILKNEKNCMKKSKKSCSSIMNLWIIFEMKSIDFEKKENKRENSKKKKS